MSDIHGAAAPESSPAPELPLDTPNPVSTEADGHPEPDAKPEGKPDKVEAKPEVKSEARPAKPLSTREALEKARDTVEKESKAAEPGKDKPDLKAAKPDAAPVKSEPVKDEKTGKFVSPNPKPEPAKPSYTAGEPPARFTPDVKATWATLPENVRGEVSRMERELTQGYEKHKQGAEAYEGYRELDDIAKQSGKRGSDVFREYYKMEQHLQKDLVGGLDVICQKMGVSFRDVAAHVMGQKPEQVSSQQDATIRDLKNELASLKQQVGGVTKTFQQQMENTTKSEVEKFATAPGHERFHEIADDIAFFLKTRTNDLAEAYTLADRLNPASPKATDNEAPKALVIDLSAQTEKGQKSINGAPGNGSFPAASKPSNSIRDALKKAVAAAG